MTNSIFCHQKWYKGNLHCHSTMSDGLLEPEDVVEIYRRSGWNFLALTEHQLYTSWADYDDDQFIILPGIEIGLKLAGQIDKCHHVVGLHRAGHQGESPRHREEFVNASDIQSSIAQLTAANYLPIYCHPTWSRVELPDIESISGWRAMEIYNNGCELETHTGFAVELWDALLRRGRKVWGVATDDAHHRLSDRCGGWVMVNAPSLTRVNIVKALEEGRLYSSTGPEIRDFGLRGSKCFVECSPVQSIHFVSYERRGRSYHAQAGSEISAAVHTLRGDETFVRVECVDRNGRTAWSNPIFLGGEDASWQ